jgi:DNA-binding LytR/AlgR family response regulator
MIRVAVVEDETQYAQRLCQYIETYGKEHGCSFSVTCYSDGDLLVEHYCAQFDLILMDVDMPLMDGFTAAQQIRQVDQSVLLIFITNMAQHAIRGYQVDALDYVLKDLTYESFSLRLSRAISRIPKQETVYLSVPIKGGMRKLDIEQLYYVESQGHQLVFHTVSGEIQSSGTMKETEDLLKDRSFFRCHNCYLVNLRHVDGVRNGCVLIQGEELLISRPRRQPFLDALTQYMGGVDGS